MKEALEKFKQALREEELNIFQVLGRDGELVLRSMLKKLSVPDLVKIIHRNAFRSYKLGSKQNDKNWLVDFIVDQAIIRSKRGKTFLDY